MYKTYLTNEILHLPQTVKTEELQGYILKKHGVFQVYKCKYLA